MCLYVTDCLAGHDSFDSTTLPVKHEPFIIGDDISIKGLHVGIPKVIIVKYHIHIYWDILFLHPSFMFHLYLTHSETTMITIPYNFREFGA